jgi:hypothetical protein
MGDLESESPRPKRTRVQAETYTDQGSTRAARIKSPEASHKTQRGAQNSCPKKRRGASLTSTFQGRTCATTDGTKSRDTATRGEQQDHTRGHPRKNRERTGERNWRERQQRPEAPSRIYMRAQPSPGCVGKVRHAVRGPMLLMRTGV